MSKADPEIVAKCLRLLDAPAPGVPTDAWHMDVDGFRLLSWDGQLLWLSRTTIRPLCADEGGNRAKVLHWWLQLRAEARAKAQAPRKPRPPQGPVLVAGGGVAAFAVVSLCLALLFWSVL